MEMITPLPVPIHRRLHDTIRAVILTNEKPSLPVPGTQTELLSLHFQNKLLLCLLKTDDCTTDPAFCWHRAQCRHPGGAGRCERGRAWGWSRVWWTPRYRRRPRPADVPDCLYEGGHQMISAVYKNMSSLDMKQREDFRIANHYHKVTVPLSSWL